MYLILDKCKKKALKTSTQIQLYSNSKSCSAEEGEICSRSSNIHWRRKLDHSSKLNNKLISETSGVCVVLISSTIIYFASYWLFLAYGLIDKRCYQIFIESKLPRETLMDRYMSSYQIREFIEESKTFSYRTNKAVYVQEGTIHNNQEDIMGWMYSARAKVLYGRSWWNIWYSMRRLVKMTMRKCREYYGAVVGRKLESIKWRLANGCPYHREAVSIAPSKGHDELV